MSISEAIERGRKRAQSVTATDVVDSLKAPISYKLVVSVLRERKQDDARSRG